MAHRASVPAHCQKGAAAKAGGVTVNALGQVLVPNSRATSERLGTPGYAWWYGRLGVSILGSLRCLSYDHRAVGERRIAYRKAS